MGRLSCQRGERDRKADLSIGSSGNLLHLGSFSSVTERGRTCDGVNRSWSETEAHREIGNVVALVGGIVDEQVLVHVADFAAEPLRERGGNGDEVADPIQAALLLERRCVEIEEGLAAKVERDLSFDR